MRFTIATINVHSFQDPWRKVPNTKTLIESLKKHSLDLVVAQEAVDDENWALFCEGLDLPHNAFVGSEHPSFGNGVASRYKIKWSLKSQVNLDKKTLTRSLLTFGLRGDHPFVQDVTFGVTHLDSLHEKSRLEQLKLFNPLGNKIDILMGDMNSLTQTDYSLAYYDQHINQIRRVSNLEPPSFHVTDLITNTWSYKDAFTLMNPSLQDRDVATCLYGTRVDYIYLHPEFKSSWALKKCVISNMNQITDHNAVVAVFKSPPNHSDADN